MFVDIAKIPQYRKANLFLCTKMKQLKPEIQAKTVAQLQSNQNTLV